MSADAASDTPDPVGNTSISTEIDKPVVSRPVKIRRYIIPAAVVLFGAFTIAGILMRRTATGVVFEHSDQVAMVGIGLLLAAAALLALRPRVRADANGIEVRNVVNGRTFGWEDVRGVSFPSGAPWARVELLADEYYPVMGIQAHDGQRAVDTMRALRALHREAHPED